MNEEDKLAARAAEIYPNSEALQREWVRAVRLVRKTPRGWVCDNPQRRCGGVVRQQQPVVEKE